MHRPVALTDQTSFQAVSNVQYNAANQLTSMNYYFFNETRQYNSLNQLTNLNGITYNYPAGSNNGKISSQVVSGETITYQYDSLNRLASAAGSGWAENYGYDSFGNLVSKTPTAGSPPQLSIAVDPATNRIVGQFYDANGNQQSLTYTYDVENRVVGAAGVQYAYDSQNKRIWKTTWDANGNPNGQEAYFYGVDGQKLGTYALLLNYGSGQPYLINTASNLGVYFGGKRVGTIDQTGAMLSFVTDRLGSHGSYYPYGEEKTTPLPNDEVKFATYTRDSATGLDYADQRYCSSQFGRFLSPDPYRASSGPSNPASWNRYSYVGGDPVNNSDPFGLDTCPVGSYAKCVDVFANLPPDLRVLYAAYAQSGGASGFNSVCPGYVFDEANAGCDSSQLPRNPPPVDQLPLHARIILAAVWQNTQFLTTASFWAEWLGASIITGTGGVAAFLYAGEAGGILALGVGASETFIPVIGRMEDLAETLGPDGKRAFEALGNYDLEANLAVINRLATSGMSFRDVSVDAAGNLLGGPSRVIDQERDVLRSFGYVLEKGNDDFWYWVKH